jgi:hypothetical protein
MKQMLLLAVAIGLVIAAIKILPQIDGWDSYLKQFFDQSASSPPSGPSGKIETVSQTPEDRFAAISDNRTNVSVDFQGLPLGLPLSKLPALLKAKGWKVFLDDPISANPNQTVLIDSISEIGSEPDKSFHYNVYGIYAVFEAGKLVEFTVGGMEFSEIIRAKRWMEFAYAGLVKKYGAPQLVIIPLDAVTPAHFRSGEVRHFMRWKVGNRSITLGGTGAGHYQPQVIYSDMTEKARVENRAKSESNM